MALNFTTTYQEGMQGGIKCLVYGRSGVGKTRLCATAPAPLIISAERGLLSLRQYDIPVLRVDNVQDLQDVYHFVSNPNEPKMAAIQTICLDSITEIGEQVLSAAKVSVKDNRQAYGELIETMTQLIKNFRDIPGKNVVFIAKQEFSKDEATGATKNVPSMPGAKLSQALPYFFDEVFCLRAERDNAGAPVHFLQTLVDFQYDAKDRSGALAPSEHPDLSLIFNKILGV